MDHEQLKHLENKLKETKETREKGLQEIKDWASKNNLKITIRLEDKYILPFLRVSKYDIERTKKKITNFYTLKRDRPEWFLNRNPRLEIVKELIDIGIFLPLRQKTKDNQLVVFVRTGVHDPSIHTIDDFFKVGLMLLDVASMEDENAHVYGITAIFDVKGLSFGHAKQYTPRMLQKTVQTIQSYHCRPQQMNFVNAPAFINGAIQVFKSFMTAKLKERVHVRTHGDDSVQEILGLEITPKEYGGNGESVEFLKQYWFKKLIDYSKWFVEDEKFKAH